MQSSYHNPVLLNTSIEGLNIDPNGIYVDVTFGGGGHSKELLKKINNGKLVALDQDDESELNADALMNDIRDKDNFIFYRTNFKYLSHFLKLSGISQIDGLIADLGVSSHQFDETQRGFSFRLGGKPDMRMNQKAKKTSYAILNGYSESQLAEMFRNYGEIKSSYKLAAAIVKEREIYDLDQLNSIVRNTLITKKDYKILAQVYQAIRIETNNEIENLKSLLIQCSTLIKKSGRLVVISYHSLEDRIVKNFIKSGNFSGLSEKDVYGMSKPPFKEVGKVIVPEDVEIKMNNRARSAKLRIAEKT